MEHYKINGKSISMPTGWHDVKYSDACNIIDNNLNPVQIFSLFSGIDEQEVERLNREDDIYYFLKGFPFLEKMPIEDKPAIPRSINYKGERVIFPHVIFNDPYDFGNTTVGQIEDMKAVISKKVKDIVGDEERDINNMELLTVYPYVAAIYIQPIIENEYNYNRAMKMAKELRDEMSFKEVVYMGNFFLMKLGSLVSGSKRGLLQRLWTVKKLRRGYRRLTNYLDSMQP